MDLCAVFLNYNFLVMSLFHTVTQLLSLQCISVYKHATCTSICLHICIHIPPHNLPHSELINNVYKNVQNKKLADVAGN
jgi:hypothetical protein